MQNFACSYPREPSLDDLSLLAEEAFARLPEPFRAACGRVVFRVAEGADPATLHGLLPLKAACSSAADASH